MPMVYRITLLLCLIFLSQVLHAESLWPYFKQNFITDTGRVIDTQQQGISHSEGQGYGMLLSVKFNDRRTFNRLWLWTRKNLQTRNDKLFSWKFGRAESGEYQVLDENNATDGDVLIAWALLQAYQKWNIYQYLTEARHIQEDLIRYTLIEYYGHMFLMPAVFGFQHGQDYRLNPSYLVFPAYAAFAKAFSGPWTRLLEDSKWLLQASLHADLKLPSDWVTLDGRTGRIGNDDHFSSEAIRVWLYEALLSNGTASVFPGFRHWQNYFERHGHYPDRFDAQTFRFEGYGMPGYWAVSARVLSERGENQAAKRLWQKAKKKLLREEINYYSCALYLLSIDQGRSASQWGSHP